MKRGRPRTLSDDEIRRAAELREKGWTRKAVAGYLGLPFWAVKAWTRKPCR